MYKVYTDGCNNEFGLVSQPAIYHRHVISIERVSEERRQGQSVHKIATGRQRVFCYDHIFNVEAKIWKEFFPYLIKICLQTSTTEVIEAKYELTCPNQTFPLRLYKKKTFETKNKECVKNINKISLLVLSVIYKMHKLIFRI